MHWQYTPYTLFLATAAAVSLAGALFVWKKRSTPGAPLLTLMMLAAAWWSAAYAVEISSTDFATKLLWGKLQYLGIATIPLALFAFTVHYTGRSGWLSARNLSLLCVLPVLTLALVATNGSHGLIWSRTWLDTSGAFAALEIEHGPMFYLYWLYACALLLAGSALLISVVLRSRALYRMQSAAVLIGLAAPWLANIVYVLELVPLPALDPTPMGFTVTGAALAWGLARLRLLDLTPVTYRSIVEGMGEGVIVLDPRDRVVDLNPAAGGLLSCPPSEAVGKSAAEVVDHWEPLEAQADESLVEVEDEAARRSYLLKLSPLTDSQGRLTGRLITAHDITERQRASRELRESEERYRQLVELSPDAVAVHSEGRVAYINTAGARTLGAESPEELIGRPILDFVHPDYKESVMERVRRGYDGKIKVGTVREKLVRLDGQAVDVETAAMPISYSGKAAVQLVVRDVTERKALEDQLSHRAFHDSLTGLPNRTLFLDRLGNALSRTEREKSQVGMLFLDLDGFKLINDTLGHECGDQLLIASAERLTSCVREGDTVARLGGDEFTVLLENLESADEATAVAERITGEFQEPFEVAGREVFVKTSIGLAYSLGGESSGDLLRDADVAMYQAKNGSGASYEVFEPGMNRHALERLELEGDLRRAIQRGEFELLYQPGVDLATGEVSGVEALLRWRHPSSGVLRPADFISTAEETGMMLQIGRWVLEEACRQAGAWRGENPGRPMPPVYVNLSASQLRHPEVARDIGEILRQTGLEPSGLSLEITERVLMEEARSTIGALRELESLGVRLALDDFGTGYSSLSYLKRFPIDTIKIDCLFVAGLGESPDDTALVSSMIGLAHALEKEVVAEGVEHERQLAQLRELGCEHAQGNLFREPLTAGEMSALLAEQVPRTNRQTV